MKERAMKEIVTSLTQRGQVTVPAEVRRLLGLKPRDKVTFAIDNDQVRLVPATFTLESAYGSVTPQNRPEDFKALGRIAREERTKPEMGKQGDQ
jgi:AbrB family looped-hinge helix DNA binding protein